MPGSSRSDPTPSICTISDDTGSCRSDATPSDGTPSDEEVDPEASSSRRMEEGALLADPKKAALIDEFRAAISDLDREQKKARLWEMLRACEQADGKVRPTILGVRISFRTWTHLLGVSLHSVYRLLKHLQEGNSRPPPDLRRGKKESVAIAAAKADAWLTYAYTCLAEPLAEARVCDFDESAPPGDAIEEDIDMHVLASAKEWVWGPTCSKGATAALGRNERSLPWMTFRELHSLHVQTCRDQPVSVSSLVRAWHAGDWGKVLKFRPVGTHSKCATCCRLREWKRACATEEDRARVMEAHSKHVARIMRDRAVDNRMNELAARCMDSHEALPAEWDPHGSMTIDGMDQSKFKVPRFSAAARGSKEFDGHWRPNLHVHGSLVYGCVETFYVCDLDLGKDADLQVTAMARSLQLSYQILSDRGVNMPKGWRFHYDNTAAEGKNATCFRFYSLLVALDAFDVIDGTSFEVGHTHNIQDQRFATAAAALSRADKLETPEDFVQRLRDGVQPTNSDVQCHVEKIEAAYNWTEWLRVLGCCWHGHTSTERTKKRQEDAVRVFRFMKRKKLPAGAEVQSTFPEEASGEDVVVLVKQSICSDQYIGLPIVCLPHARAVQLDRATLQIAPRRVFTEEQKKNFLKTAGAIREQPWSMVRASDYIRALVSRNDDAGHDWSPPDISWIWLATRMERRGGAGSIQGAALAPELPPQAVSVGDTARRRRRKAPAAAEGAAAPKRQVRAADFQAVPPEVMARLGCTRCRQGKFGCLRCRRMNNLVFQGDRSVHAPPGDAVAL